MTFCRPLAKKFHSNVGELSNETSSGGPAGEQSTGMKGWDTGGKREGRGKGGGEGGRSGKRRDSNNPPPRRIHLKGDTNRQFYPSLSQLPPPKKFPCFLIFIIMRLPK